MHNANITKSGRLQKFMEFMTGSVWRTTREIIEGTGLCAVNSIAAEIRANGVQVDCLYSHMTDSGARVYKYRVVDKNKMELSL